MEAYREFAAVYDQLMADMPYAEWLQFAQEVWSKLGTKPSSIVDLGCGTGSIAIPLASAGYKVVGIDLSSDMLAIASEKWEKKLELKPSKGTLQLIEQNMSEWQTAEPVDTVISFCDCLNYLLDEDQLLATFQATYDGLKPGGSFLFDVHPISRFQQYAENQPFIYDEGGISYLWSSDYDDEEHLIEHELAIFVEESDGRYRRFDEEHVQRAYHSRWIVGALQASGFTEIHQYADFQLKQANEQSERLFFVAVK